MDAARERYANAQLLDRQLVDRSGRRCGKVDDLELRRDDATGALLVSGIHAGPGALLVRTGRRRLGRWLRGLATRLSVDGRDRVIIPIRHVADLGNHVTLSLDAEELATHGGERWVWDHLISHLPGSGSRAAE
jgi:sporulation protein YlmC with PRC-barrel domain